MCDIKMFKTFYGIAVGDLVRLKGDSEMSAGLGLVVDIKVGTEDLVDFLEAMKVPELKDDLFDLMLNKPQVAVFWWHRQRSSRAVLPPIWFPIEEIVAAEDEETD
jgi:hypothetical protein